MVVLRRVLAVKDRGVLRSEADALGDCVGTRDRGQVAATCVAATASAARIRALDV